MDVHDSDIVHRVRAGDIDAFAVIIQRYYAPCYRYALRMLLEADEAEDAVQETFIRAYRALPRYQDRGRFREWLFRILLNRCRSVAGRRRPAPLAEVVEAPAQAPHDERVLWRDEVTLALGDLPPILREAFLLRHVEEMTYQEMAELTGDGVSALKMRVSRACAALRGTLQEALDDG